MMAEGIKKVAYHPREKTYRSQILDALLEQTHGHVGRCTPVVRLLHDAAHLLMNPDVL